MKIKVYIYKNPFEMKDFTADENWIIDQDISIEENVSNFMVDVLYPMNFNELLREGILQKVNQKTSKKNIEKTAEQR